MVVYGKLVFFDLRGRKKQFLKGLGLSKSTVRAIRICFVEVSPDLVLLDIRKSIFNVLLPEEEDLLLLEEEDLLLLEEEDLLLLEEEDLLLKKKIFNRRRSSSRRRRSSEEDLLL